MDTFTTKITASILHYNEVGEIYSMRFSKFKNQIIADTTFHLQMDENNGGNPREIFIATPLAIENELDTDNEKSSNTADASEDIQKNRDTTDNVNIPPLVDLLVRPS